MDLTVACVLYRDKTHVAYDQSYVEKMQSMVARNIKIPHRFVCYSNVEVPCDRIPLAYPWKGWWSKMEVFDVERHAGNILFIDLDTVIVKNITPMLRHMHFTMLHGFHGTRLPLGSGFMLLPQSDRQRIWNEFMKSPSSHIDNNRGDQDFIGRHANNAKTWQELYPDNVISYKLDCLYRTDKLPTHARVVCFHGHPRPHELPETHWIYDHWNTDGKRVFKSEASVAH